MCSTTPRFSYPVPETGVTGYEHGSGTVCQRVGGYRVGVPGWVYRVGTPRGNTGYPPSQLLEEDPEADSEAGPRKPLQGLEWGGLRVRTYGGGGDGLSPPLRGPVGPMLDPPWDTPLDAAS